MYPSVPKCTQMYPNVPKCTKCTQMYPNVPKCTKCTQMYPNVPNCTKCTKCTQMYQMYQMYQQYKIKHPNVLNVLKRRGNENCQKVGTQWVICRIVRTHVRTHAYAHCTYACVRVRTHAYARRFFFLLVGQTFKRICFFPNTNEFFFKPQGLLKNPPKNQTVSCSGERARARAIIVNIFFCLVLPNGPKMLPLLKGPSPLLGPPTKK